MAVHLGSEPGSVEAHAKVRAWLQAELDRNNDPGRLRVSQWLLGQALDAMVSPELRGAYGQWLDKTISGPPQKRRRRQRRAA